MAFNLVKALCDRESGKRDLTTTCILLRRLDQLYIQEWWFDHRFILPLVRVLKTLVIRHATIRAYVFSALEGWEIDEDNRSVVFLARSLARDLSSHNLEYLTTITDEIMMLSK